MYMFLCPDGDALKHAAHALHSLVVPMRLSPLNGFLISWNAFVVFTAASQKLNWGVNLKYGKLKGIGTNFKSIGFPYQFSDFCIVMVL